MTLVQTQHWLIVALFMAALLVVWGVVKLFKTPLRQHLSADRRMALTEVLPLGPDQRAVLMSVDGRDVLIISGRRTGTAVEVLPTRTPEGHA